MRSRRPEFNLQLEMVRYYEWILLMCLDRFVRFWTLSVSLCVCVFVMDFI